ncbi:MAG: linear amide C-N hydrolase [Pirellulaceae bacterium]|nr:linear amide C-N hydrolase [Pirellulaceae bacterium]
MDPFSIRDRRRSKKLTSANRSYGHLYQEIQGVAPLHHAVFDSSGGSIVIEYTESGLTIHENTVNAIANNPTYDWQITNLRNYVGLRPINRDLVTVARQTLRPFGQGTGLFSLTW